MEKNIMIEKKKEIKKIFKTKKLISNLKLQLAASEVRMTDLELFIENEKVDRFYDDDDVILDSMLQLHSMKSYHKALEKRINHFENIK